MYAFCFYVCMYVCMYVRVCFWCFLVYQAVTNAGVTLADVAFHEINEAFAVVALANARILGLKEDTINVHGGAVALGKQLAYMNIDIYIHTFDCIKLYYLCPH